MAFGADPYKKMTCRSRSFSHIHRKLLADFCNWIAIAQPTAPIKVLAKARSRMTEQPATVYPLAGGSVRVEFDTPQRAITPGQAVVFYDGDTVLGGGTIAKAL